MNLLQGMFGGILPRARIDQGEQQLLARLSAQLERHGYTEDLIKALLNLNDMPHRRFDQVPGYLYNCRQNDTPGSRLVRLFMLGDTLSPDVLDELLGSDLVALMLKLDLLERRGDGLAAAVDVYPCLGTWILTDPRFARQAFTHQVYQLGTDSYVLARVTPRRPVERALDLCTGSGVHPVLAARHAQESWGVDINPRALEFSRMNAWTNGLGDRCHFVKSDLYTNVSGPFQLITANPPFVPTPTAGMELFRTGGASGEEVTEGIVRGLVEHLAPGGTFSMFTNYPVFRDSHHLDRMAEWLGGPDGWGLTVLNFLWMPNELFISLHANPHAGEANYRREFDQYLQSYEEQGIEAVVAANFFVRRLPPGTPGWRAERAIPFPATAMDEVVAQWLDALEEPLPDLATWKPQRHREFGRMFVDPESGRGLVQFRDFQWAPLGTELNPEAAWLVQHADGKTTAEELARRLGQEWEQDCMKTIADSFRQLRHELILQ